MKNEPSKGEVRCSSSVERHGSTRNPRPRPAPRRTPWRSRPRELAEQAPIKFGHAHVRFRGLHREAHLLALVVARHPILLVAPARLKLAAPGHRDLEKERVRVEECVRALA